MQRKFTRDNRAELWTLSEYWGYLTLRYTYHDPAIIGRIREITPSTANDIMTAGGAVYVDIPEGKRT